jgi:hypothetical protein
MRVKEFPQNAALYFLMRLRSMRMGARLINHSPFAIAGEASGNGRELNPLETTLQLANDPAAEQQFEF